MQSRNQRTIIFSLMLVLAIFGHLMGQAGPTSADTQGPPWELAQALARAQAAGSHRFTAHVEQKLHPRPITSMIGQGSQQLSWALDGAREGSDRARLEINLAVGVGEHRSATLIQQGEQTYLLRGDSLEPVTNPLNVGAPTTDYLEYIAAAHGVRQLEPIQAAGQTFMRYQFDIDGRTLALRTLADLERQLQGKMPPGVQLQPPQNLARMTGSSEVWVDEAGLPRRQILNLYTPEVDPRYSAETSMVIDFWDFGQAGLVPHVVPGHDGSWQLLPASASATGSTSFAEGQVARPPEAGLKNTGATARAAFDPAAVAPSGLLVFLVILAIMVFVRFYQKRPRLAYATIAISTVLLLCSGPLLQAARIVGFQEHMANAASAEPVAQALGLTLDAANANSQKPAISAQAEQAMAGLLRGQAAPGDAGDEDPLFVACGIGSNTTDSDDDGLSDFVENCYGTNYLLADSDFDGVPDGVETTGFEYNGRHWYGNALSGDSNGDGLSDAAAWTQPAGTAPALDVDGDGIPNLWDDDSDGDGVPNGQDLAPFAVTPSKPAMTLNIADDGFDGYRTIEFQIQPQNLTHLRYTLTALDWPYDEQGQMRDLNGSNQDIRLAPYLTIEPNVAPSADLREQYGVIYFEKTIDVNNAFFAGAPGNTYTQRTMMVPLVPQGTSAITNFYGKIAYDPSSGSIDWANARLVWLVAGEVDTAFDCGRAAPCVRTESKVLHQYYEPFRLSGLRINKSGQHEMVLFGTPNSPTEDKSLLNLMYGMEGTFLEAEQMAGQALGRTALGEIVNRFEQPSTPIELKWGVTEPVAMSRQVYTHADQLYANGTGAIRSFLDGHFLGSSTPCTDSSGSQFDCASVIFALESWQGSLELGRIQEIANSPPPGGGPGAFFLNNGFAVFWAPQASSGGNSVTLQQQFLEANNIRASLGDVPLARERSLRLQMYDHSGGAWNAVTPARMMELVEYRYGPQWENMLTEMHQVYPTLNETDMRLGAYVAYLTANAGMARTIDINGANLVADISDDLAFYATQLALSTALRYTPSFALGVSGIASGLSAFDEHYFYISYRPPAHAPDSLTTVLPGSMTGVGSAALLERLQAIQSWEGGKAAGYVKAGISTALLVSNMALAGIGMAMQVANAVCAGLQDQCDAKALEIANTVVGAVSQVSLLIQIGQAVATVIKVAQNGATLAKATATGSVVLFAVAFIFFAIQVILIWVTYALIVNNTDSNLAKAQAEGQAVASTYVAGVFLMIGVLVGILALFLSLLGPIGIVIGIAIGILIGLFFLIDFIVGAVGEDSVTAKFARSVADALTDIELLQEPKDAHFAGTRSTVSSFNDLMRADGFVPGTKLNVADQFYGDFEGGEVTAGQYEDWEGSVAPSAYATFKGVPGGVAFTDKNQPPQCGPKVTWTGSPGSLLIGESDSSEWECTNSTGVEYRFDQPALNAVVSYKVEIAFEFWFRQCETNVAPLPGLRPETIDSETCDVDRETRRLPQDGDNIRAEDWQVTTYYDILPATLDELWNWDRLNNPDRDGDGLPAYRVPNTSGYLEPPYMTNPNHWDTDGDGLSDGYEVRSQAGFGLDPTAADRDADRLPDSLELRLGSGANNPDSDGDGLPDGAEVFHADPLSGPGAWLGGWEVLIPGHAPMQVFPDPLVADADGDGLTDAMEKRNGTSPYAVNNAPALLAVVTPLVVAPDGRQGAFVEPGDAVDVDLGLFNTGSQPVTTTLELCLPALLVNVQGGQMQGDRTPPTQTGACAGGANRYAWTFNTAPGNPQLDYRLQVGDSVTATFGTTANPALPTSATGVISTSLPYSDKLLAGNTRVYVDNDDPAVAFMAPTDGSFLRGSSYVIGGSASDPTSWVTHVLLDTGGGFQPVTGVGPWASTWMLPGDGVYTLRAQAFDYFDRASAEAETTVTVDNTPPSAGHSLPNGAILTTTGGVIALSGPASDNLSGIERVQISLDGKPWREISFDGQGSGPLNTTWHYDWPVGVNAQGSHGILVRSFDRAGNISDAQAIEVIIDTLPPTDELTRRLRADTITLLPADPTISLGGRANDAGRAPLPPRPSPLSGEMDAISNATVWLEPSSIFESDNGVSITWLGDVDGDGLGDLAAGFPASAGHRGAVYVVYGKAGNWKLPSDVEALTDAGAVFFGVEAAAIGLQVAAAGDVDSDGLSDFLIGDPSHHRVYLIFGRTVYLGRQELGDRPAAAQAIFVVPDSMSLGGAVAAAGDVNGDGYADLLLTSDNQALLLLGSGDWRGQVIDANAVTAARITLAGGFAVGVGDVANNQRDAIAVTAPGGVYLLSLPVSLAAGDNVVIDPNTSNLAFLPGDAAQVVALGDVNGDSIDDFIYGGGGNTPRLVYGGQDSWSVSVNFSGLTPAATGFVAAPGDVNGDGVNDLLLGAANDQAYLVYGGAGLNSAGPVQATLMGVAGAASTPFASGADVNCDFSSELLLLPSNSGFLAGLRDYGEQALVDISTLPVAHPVNPRAAQPADRSGITAVNRYVDDDGQCDGQTPCTATIQAAVDAAAAGDTITVYPGVYQESVNIGAGKDGLTIAGLDADAVFVDGAGAASVFSLSSVNGVALRKLTLRNAQAGVQLTAAGVLGYANPTNTIRLDRLAIHSVTNAISMNRTSNLAISRSTLVNSGGSNSLIQVTGSADPVVAPAWTALTAVPASVYAGSTLLSPPPTSTSNGLGFLYEFNEGSGLTTANSAYDGDISGAAWTSDTPAASYANPRALEFDGIDDGVQSLGWVPELASGNFSVAFWAKRASSGVQGYVLAQGQASNNLGLHVGFRSDNRFTCAFWGNDLNTAAAYTDTDWHHWVCTYNVTTNQRTIYRDGVQVAQGTASADYLGSGQLLIGRRFDGANFAGKIDDVRVYTRVLLASELAGSGYASLPATNPNLVLYWNLDDGLGATARNYARANGAFVAMDPATSWTSSAPLMGAFNPYALDFDGVDGTMSISPVPQLAARSFSVAFWARRDSAGTDDLAVSQGAATNNQGLHIGFRSNNQFTCAFWGNDLNTAATYTDNAWHQWTCTYDAATNQRTIYRDGVQVAQGTAAADYQGIGSLYIGSRFGTAGYFDGAIDDVRIYDQVLSIAEVQTLSNALSLFTSGDNDSTVTGADTPALRRYQPAANSWSSSATPPGVLANERPAMAAADDGYAYFLRSNNLGGLNGTVEAMVVDGSEVFVGGAFTQATNPDGSTVNVSGIARWDGRRWTALGGGVSGSLGRALALALDGNNLYVGGAFTQVIQPGGAALNANYVARWSRSAGNWSALGSGFNGYVESLAVSSGSVYAGGSFTDASYYYVNNAIQQPNCLPNEYEITLFEHDQFNSDPGSPGDWDGWCEVLGVGDYATAQSWGDHNDQASSILVGAFVRAILYQDQNFGGSSQTYTFHESNLGNQGFNDQTTSVRVQYKQATHIHHVARWDGSAWQAMQHGVGGLALEVGAFAPVAGGLFVGGVFDSASGLDVSNIAFWNGSSWDRAGYGVNNRVRSLAAGNGVLYVGGDFTNATYFLAGPPYVQIIPANQVAQYNSLSPGSQTTWSALGSGLNGNVEDLLFDSSTLYAGGWFSQSGATTTRRLASWNGSSWQEWLGGVSGANAIAKTLALDSDGITVAGQFTQAGALAAGVTNITRWANSYRYHDATDAWEAWTPPATLFAYQLNSPLAVSDGVGNLYLAAGAGRTEFYRYNIAGNTWTARASLPAGATPGANAAFAWANGAGYLLTGSGLNFYRYTASSNAWTQMANAPLALGAGAALTWDGVGALYAQGGGSAFWRYDISANTWQVLAAPNVGGSAGAGAGLAARGNQLFGTVGAGAASFRRYGPVGLSVTKLTLDKVALVAPATAASAAWTNLTSATANNDFQIVTGSSRWVAGAGTTWTPSAPSTLTVAQAQFLDVPSNLYRVGAGSTLGAGYYDYHAPVTVSAASCPGCYTSLQAAILSGAQRVLLEPGVYQEPAWLVSGVRVLGSGAETTILQPATQAGVGQVTATALLRGEGISSATVARLTLNGDGSADGARFEDGAANVVFTRNIVRGAGAALSFDGAATNVEVVNNTLVDNDNGLRAANCANVDVRNTIFASQGVALSYQTCASTELHQYNDYYGNSQDYVINGTPVNQPGVGEIAADPLFTDPLTHNYRPLPESPVIDSGNPSDPAPPGAGGRADMGYVEYGAAGFYVDDDYCATCLNDGLIWQIDAFDDLQDALDALAQQVAALGAPVEGQVTVGVADGQYNGPFTLPSYANVVCSSPGALIYGNPAIIIADAVQAGVSNCTVGADFTQEAIRIQGASPNVLLRRNVISGATAIRLQDQSSAVVEFNTMIYGFSGVHTLDDAWAEATNNILYGGLPPGCCSPVVTPESDTYLLWAEGNSRIASDYNLLYVTDAPTVGFHNGDVVVGAQDVTGVNPLFVDPQQSADLQPQSPAVDTADPRVQAPPGGGRLADRGAVELRATPLALLFGRLAPSCTEGNSGVASTEVGLAPFSDYTTPLTATLPAAWVNAPLLTPGQTASYWNASVLPPAGDGYYRVFTRAADVAGNAESDVSDWFSGVIQVDGSAPAVSWIRGADTTEAAMLLVASTPADDAVASGFQVENQFYPGQRLIGAGPDYTFYAWAPALDGSYQVSAQVTDRAGNTGASAPRTINVTTPAHVATITSVLDDGASNSPILALSGYARFTDTTGVGQVTVSVNGGAPIMADVADTSAALTAWSASVTLPGSGLQTLQVTASRTTQLAGDAQAVGSQAAVESPDNAITILVDQVAPSLTITHPAPGAVVTQTAMLQGTVTDASSGVDRVEFSVDGGLTWQDAQVNGAAWSAVWISPVDQPFVSYPLTVRAFDQAGNVASASRSFTVDLDPPNGFYPLSFNYPVGSHLDTFSSLQVSWQPVFDTSNLVTVTVAIDQNAASTPTTVVNGTSFSRALDAPGDWYVHIKASDAAGNNLSSDHGPWRVGTFADTAVDCGARMQTIALDGLIDLTNQEWKAAAELLDTDFRPANPQSLYATWDGSAFYLGWQGAWWDLDGTLWAYLNTGATGATTPIAGGPQALPFAANYAIEISGASSGVLWTYSGGGWQPGALPFSLDESGGAEVRLPWNIGSISQVRLLAYAMNDNGIWSAFPTTNRLDGQAWTGSYQWSGLCNTFDPGSGQPRGDQATLLVTSPQSQAVWYGSGDALSYVVSVGNTRPTTMTNALVTLEATAGLRYQSVQGATCVSCPPNGATWQVLLAEIPGQTTQSFTVAGQLAADLGAVTIVTSTAMLPVAINPAVSLAHLVDGVRPVLTLGDGVSPFQKPGPHTISGQADDSPGSGVALVEYRQAGAGSWQTAAGASIWQADVNVTGSGVLTLEFRATDRAGNQSDIVSAAFGIDNAAPLISAQIPAVITHTVEILPGTASDPAPTGSRVALLEMQADAADRLWQALAAPGAPDQAGQQSWSASWFLDVLDNETRQVRFRATDLAGNTTTTGWQTTLVDNVSPAIGAAQPLTRVVISDYTIGGPPQPPVLLGTATDGAGINRLVAIIYAPDGEISTQAVDFAAPNWAYRPQFAPGAPTGQYILRISAEDMHGNRSVAGPFDLLVEPQATASVNAQLAFQALSVVPANVSVTTVLSPTIGALRIYTPTVGPAGQITLSGVPLGTYDVWVKHANHLARRVTGVVVTPAGVTGLNLGTLPGGDANDSNAVTGADFSILAPTYLLGQGDPGYDGRADFNLNGFISGADFSILASSYLQAGAPRPPAPADQAVQEQISPADQPHGTVQLRMTPAEQVVDLGQEFSVAVMAEAGAQPVDMIDTFLSFDPARLQVLEIVPGATLPTVLASNFDNTNGRLGYSAGKQLGGPDPNGSFTLMTVRFQARTTATPGSTALTFVFQPPIRSTDVFYRGQSVLGLTQNAGITIQPGALCYDFNGDGRVGAPDIMLVAARFENPQAYQAQFDLDQNGVIDVLDIITMAAQWNRQCN